MPLTIEQFKLLKELENLSKKYPPPTGYPSLRPQKYITRGSAAHFYLEFLFDKAHRWTKTSELHHIYYSPYGTHVNTLIRLAKGKFIVGRCKRMFTDAKDWITTVRQWEWRILPKGFNYVLKQRSISPEDIINNFKERVILYLRKQRINFRIDGNDLYLEHCSTPIDLSYLAQRTTGLRRLRHIIYYHARFRPWREAQREERKRRAQELFETFLKNHPDAVQEKQTIIGTIVLDEDGDLRIGSKRFCITPGVNTAYEDEPLCRLIWLNYHTETLVKCIIRSEMLLFCQQCGSPIYSSKYSYCPFCGDLLEAQLNNMIRTRTIRIPSGKMFNAFKPEGWKVVEVSFVQPRRKDRLGIPRQ